MVYVHGRVEKGSTMYYRQNIRDARKTCGYTKEVLAEKAEISVEHMSTFFPT